MLTKLCIYVFLNRIMIVDVGINATEYIPAKFHYLMGGVALSCLCMGMISNGFVIVVYLK